MDEIILPTPAPPFAWRATAWGPALICPPIERIARHVFTTRQWALGQPRTKESGWQDVAAAMQVDPSRVVRAEQVHGCGVLVGDGAMPPSSRADIIVVRDPTKAAAVRAADCAPLVIVDTGTGAVAAAHAGWRGMVLRVPAVAVEAIVRAGGSRPADLLVAIGPSIGACCYEVGPAVRDAFETQFTDAQIGRWFLDRPAGDARNPSWRRMEAAPRPGHWYFDGWAAVREQLMEAGVPAEQIFLAGLCTASHAEVFCSHRRDGPPAGRMVGVVRPAPLHP